MTDHVEGLKFCLKLIQKLKEKYATLGYSDNELSIERVLKDIENEIGYRAYRDWRRR